MFDLVSIIDFEHQRLWKTEPAQFSEIHSYGEAAGPNLWSSSAQADDSVREKVKINKSKKQNTLWDEAGTKARWTEHRPKCTWEGRLTGTGEPNQRDDRKPSK